jgi:aldehyde:ferredoxin oxidoreductase
MGSIDELIVGRTAHVDLTKRRVRILETPRKLVAALLGGRGLNMAYLHALVAASADPLGPDNVLLFGAGLLTGYPVPNSGRMSISAKSPETGFLGDANMGGFFPARMRRSGFDRLVISGRAAHPVCLLLRGGGVEIVDGDRYWGLNVPETQTAIEEEYGKGVRSAVIGPAGENLVRFAAVMNARKNAAGRGGMGAVMGSKNLKAVVAFGDAPLPIADRKCLAGLRARLEGYLHDSKIIELYGRVGTALLYDPANKLGALRTKNSQANQWSPALGAANFEAYVERMVGCSGCTVRCRHVNRFGGEGPDFSTFALLGANTGIDDLEEIIKLGNLCNDLGLDTSSTGTVIPWAMELYERGIIGDEHTGGPLRFGDVEMVRRLIEDIAARRGFGAVLAESSRAVWLGLLPQEAAEYLIAVKNLPQSDPHDPRYMKSFALGVAVASRGADHLRNRPTLDILGLPGEVRQEVYGQPTEGDPTAYADKEVVVEWSEDIYAVSDCLGICRFVCHGWNSPKLLGYPHFVEMLSSAVGMHVTPAELREVGRRVVDLERMVNCRYGLTRADDTLPRRYFDEPMPGGATKGHRIDREEFAELLTRYYARRGWSREGEVPGARAAELEELSNAVPAVPTVDPSP